MASQVSLLVKNTPVNAGVMRRGFDPWVGKSPWKRAWQPTPEFLLENSWRSLVGYSPQDCKESDLIEETWHACTDYLYSTSLETLIHWFITSLRTMPGTQWTFINICLINQSIICVIYTSCKSCVEF